MTSLLRGWWLVSLPTATFALFESEAGDSTGGVVTDCAPYGRRQSCGKRIEAVLGFWRGRGAVVSALWWEG